MKKQNSKYSVPSFAQGMNILVVDSDTTSLMHLASLLEVYSYKGILYVSIFHLYYMLGYIWFVICLDMWSVTTTELGSVGLTMIRGKEEGFKLVIANTNMADMDCLSFLRLVLNKSIPVVCEFLSFSRVFSYIHHKNN